MRVSKENDDITSSVALRTEYSGVSKYRYSVGIQTSGAPICTTHFNYKKDSASLLEVSNFKSCHKFKTIIKNQTVMIFGLTIAVLMSSIAAVYMYDYICIANSHQINFEQKERILQKMIPLLTQHSDFSSYSKLLHDSDFSSYLKLLHDVQANMLRLANEVTLCNQNYRAMNRELRILKANNMLVKKSLIHLRKETATFVPTFKQLIDEEINLYDADKLGLTDYALESLGGRIISTYDTETLDHKKTWLTFWNFPLWPVTTHDPNNIIQASMQPGNCWCFKGSSGKVRISLYKSIYITAVTLEHISPLINPGGQITSAPKSFHVTGIVPESKTTGNKETQIQLGNFEYSTSGRAWQTFPVNYQSEQYTGPFKLIELLITANHGNAKYTCVYRIRVHGVPEENFHNEMFAEKKSRNAQ